MIIRTTDILTGEDRTMDRGSLPDSSHRVACRGFCRACNRDHLLREGSAHRHALALMEHLRRHQSVDLAAGTKEADLRLATDWLYGEARGKMFGVLECRAHDGSIVVLRAFSGQYNGLWEIDGWAPPLFDSRRLKEISRATEKEIKRLGREMAATGSPQQRLELQRRRRQLSQQLMIQIHSLYRLSNFCGRTTSLFSAFTGDGGIPTGSGDCCAPKLLNHAARRGLTPLGMAEFFWGRNNRSGGREEGRFYPSCDEKCAPILGFLLCGLEEPSPDHAA
jgi:hypothetical protein